MNQRHFGELLALWSLAVLVIVAATMITLWPPLPAGNRETASIIVGGLITALPILINSIRNIGQARAMQTMADALGSSMPAAPASDTLLLDKEYTGK